jgi:hypothetical protein
MRQRPLLPFKFRGEVPGEPAYDELGILEAAAKRGMRSASAADLGKRARASQAASGLRVRIFRPVVNQEAFKNQLQVWHGLVNERGATRATYGKGLGGLTMTLFDTSQQPLLALDESYTEESLSEKLERARPGIFKRTGSIAVLGTEQFGSKLQPFIALTFALGPGNSLLDETRTVRHTVAPELSIRDDYLPDHRLHVSLGQVFRVADAAPLQEKLDAVIPQFVEFGPATVTVEPQQPHL